MTYNLYDSITATQASPMVNCRQFQFAVIRVTTSGTVSMTLSVVGSTDTEIQTIDFGSASSNTNPWFPVSVNNQDTTTPINGSTGIVLSSAGTTSYSVNADALEYIGVVPTITSETVSVTITLCESI